jgi:Berberine and berberine like
LASPRVTRSFDGRAITSAITDDVPDPDVIRGLGRPVWGRGVVQDAYNGSNYERLVELKARYDPDTLSPGVMRRFERPSERIKAIIHLGTVALPSHQRRAAEKPQHREKNLACTC